MNATRPFVDATSRKLVYKNEAVALDHSKFSITEILTRRYPGIVSRDALIGHVWPQDEPDHPEKNIQVHITALRKMLAPMGLGITNVYDVGYRMVTLSGADRGGVS